MGPLGGGGKEPACPCRRHERRRFDPWLRKMPWRRAWQPTPLFSPGVSRGQRSLEGYSFRVCRWLPLPHLHHFSLPSPHSILIVERRVQEVKFPSKVTKLPSTPTVTRPAPKSQSNQSAEITQAKAKKACFFLNSVLQSCLLESLWRLFIFLCHIELYLR